MQNGTDRERLERLAALVRYYILVSTTAAGSGHPTSSLSAADLMTGLVFGGAFSYDVARPAAPDNDRLIFSKGHASPLLYALWAAAGAVTEEELLTLRRFGSRLEGHPTLAFPYTEAATGSLGQGLPIGVGMALNARRIEGLPYRTWVLLGDSEMAEGSQWEALQLAAHEKLDNLIAVLDVNRLGQRGETMYGRDTAAYERRVSAFGWETIVVDGHDLGQILPAYERALAAQGRPTMVIAATVKGKGVSFVEDRDGWHGKALSREQLERALAELGPVDRTLRGAPRKPPGVAPPRREAAPVPPPAYPPDVAVATRRAYGNALARLFPAIPDMVVLDGEVGNSTYAEVFAAAHPERFFEMYIAEQNMAGAALGLALRGRVPFASTFAAFWSRAADQIRMTPSSGGNVKFCGSHAGVSIGEDGSSQMGLEDIALFRAIHGSVVLYPADAMSTERLVEEAARHRGVVYLRTTRAATPLLYGPGEVFPIGGSKVLRAGPSDAVTLVAAGITLHEALAAHAALGREGIAVRVIDLYSVKPLDEATLAAAASETRAIVTVEDHVPEGGIGEAVRMALSGSPTPVVSLAVREMPRSGTPAELLEHQGISAAAIVRTVKGLVAGH
ncbi:MAG TPA: transketolase [bacterium]